MLYPSRPRETNNATRVVHSALVSCLKARAHLTYSFLNFAVRTAKSELGGCSAGTAPDVAVGARVAQQRRLERERASRTRDGGQSAHISATLLRLRSRADAGIKNGNWTRQRGKYSTNRFLGRALSRALSTAAFLCVPRLLCRQRCEAPHWWQELGHPGVRPECGTLATRRPGSRAQSGG